MKAFLAQGKEWKMFNRTFQLVEKHSGQKNGRRRFVPLFLVPFLVLVIVSFACGDSVEQPKSTDASNVRPIPRGNRVLGIAITLPENADYERAFSMVKEVGGTEVEISLAWDGIEIAPFQYSSDPDWLTIANLYYPTQGDVGVSLAINPIDTNVNRMPEDLKGLPFDDPLVIERYKRRLEFVFSQVPDLELTSFSIGNEVHAYLGADPGLWSQYQTFFKATAKYVRELRPGLLVGVKAMFEGLTGDASPNLLSINESTDLILVTYYPLKGNFKVKDPTTVRDDFRTLTQLYEGRIIHFPEAGYPTSSVLSSSEEKQAEFVREVFWAWDTYADQIQLVSFVWLSDVSSAEVEEWERYYGFQDRHFAEFLGTLGLRTSSGSGEDKEAFKVIREEAEARGW
jgi:hypothetical protein